MLQTQLLLIDDEVLHLLSTVSESLTLRNLTLATAESCTGGLLAACCTAMPGSSHWFVGSVVAYSNSIKEQVLGVPATIIARHGAVSGDCVESMVVGVRKLLKAEVGIAISGVAGPSGGSPDKPVGTVWIAWALREAVWSRRFVFSGDRAAVRASSVHASLRELHAALTR